MKKLLLLFVFILGCLQVNAQKLTPKFLEGKWETEFHNVEFKGENKKDFSITITCKDDGTPLEVIGWGFEKGKLYIETYYLPTNWQAIGKIVVLDENTMVKDVASDHPGILIYKRKQNN